MAAAAAAEASWCGAEAAAEVSEAVGRPEFSNRSHAPCCGDYKIVAYTDNSLRTMFTGGKDPY